MLVKNIDKKTLKILAGLLYRCIIIIVYFLLLAIIFYGMNFLYQCIMQNVLTEAAYA